jgi:isoleucyl-tRNA synthetase
MRDGERAEIYPWKDSPAEQKKFFDRLAGIFEKEGGDAWYARPAEDFLPPDADRRGFESFEKETDILDVWFDSGVSHMAVLRSGEWPELVRGGDGPPADVYLEGHDPHRGWFHSSLLVACALFGRAPYRAILTHGFTVDAEGRKMSKSLGNGINLDKATRQWGAELLRLWVASSDYSGDIAGDDKIMARVVDGYRRIRNTLRFLLANTSDFDPRKDAVAAQDLLEIDRWALARAAAFQADVLAHYEVYEFQPVVAGLQLFCSEDLGGFYLDILKDRLYTAAPKSLARRSAQTALWQITQALLRWMAPFLSFTAEEAWKLVGSSESIFLEKYWDFAAPDAALLAKWQRIRALREAVNKEIEALRAQGQIGSSLQAEVTLTVPADDYALLQSLGDDLKFVLITSIVRVVRGDALAVEVRPSAHAKCARCWHHRADVGADAAHPDLCGRCVSNLFGAGEQRRIA